MAAASVATAASAAAGSDAYVVVVWSVARLAAMMVPAASWEAEPPPQPVSRAKVPQATKDIARLVNFMIFPLI